MRVRSPDATAVTLSTKTGYEVINTSKYVQNTTLHQAAKWHYASLVPESFPGTFTPPSSTPRSWFARLTCSRTCGSPPTWRRSEPSG